MIFEPELHLPVYVRAHTRLALESPRKSGWEPKSLSQWAKDLLAIDCETTIGLDQKLNFGFWRWCKLHGYACIAITPGTVHPTHRAAIVDVERDEAGGSQPIQDLWGAH